MLFFDIAFTLRSRHDFALTIHSWAASVACGDAPHYLHQCSPRRCHPARFQRRCRALSDRSEARLAAVTGAEGHSLSRSGTAGIVTERDQAGCVDQISSARLDDQTRCSVPFDLRVGGRRAAHLCAMTPESGVVPLQPRTRVSWGRRWPAFLHVPRHFPGTTSVARGPRKTCILVEYVERQKKRLCLFPRQLERFNHLRSSYLGHLPRTTTLFSCGLASGRFLIGRLKCLLPIF